MKSKWRRNYAPGFPSRTYAPDRLPLLPGRRRAAASRPSLAEAQKEASGLPRPHKSLDNFNFDFNKKKIEV